MGKSSDGDRMDLGTYTRWAEGFSEASLERALDDQRALRRGQMNDGDEYNRTTPAGLSESHYRKLRSDRDDLDYREWNEETAFSGVDRWPTGAGVQSTGVQSEGQKRRRDRRDRLDDGF